MSEAKRGMFDWYFKSNLLIRIMIGLILGAIVGIILAAMGGDIAMKVNGYIKPFGDAFIRLLKMIIIPVVLFTLVVGTSSISPGRLGRVGMKTLAYYIVTSIFAATVGLLMGVIGKPGMGITLESGVGTAKAAAKTSMTDVILNLIPENFFAALSSGVILQIIFFALLFGIALAFLRDSEDARVKNAADSVFNLFDGLSEVIFIVVRWIMQYAPIGVFALMVTVFAMNGAKVVGPLIKVTIIVYIGLAVQMIFVYGGVLAIKKYGVIGFIKRARDPMLTAFVTRSSGGTLPVTIKTADNMGVSKGVYSFTLPVGATVNMDGTTIYQIICACFIANAVGMPLTGTQMFLAVLTAVLASIGTAGVPGAGAIMLLMVLEAVGLNVEAGSAVAAAYAMILGIDALLDMGRTCMNVTGDLVGAVFVADSEGEMDRAKYDAFDGSNV